MNLIEAYKEIEIQIDAISLKGNLRLADNSKGIIIFSHGSGSSRVSSRNNFVANLLLEHGYSSLLFDLLTEKEDLFRENRFNIGLLTERLIKVTQWLNTYEVTKHMLIGYFGASTGAACALSAAVLMDKSVKAVVSRGGRPDLAMPILNKINIPILLLVGSNDHEVIDLNRKAQLVINGICELEIIEGASHLFEESGKLEIVAQRTCNWFDKYLIE